jgi:long-chain acyl-CoA synthetase
MPGPDTLQQLRRELSANGENAAIIAFTGEVEETWSFAKLGDVSTRLAAGLARRGISRGDSVALIAPNSPQWIVAFWAVIGAGAVAVPLDAQNDDHELQRMIEISACRLAFSSAAGAKRLKVIAPSCETIILDRESDPAAAESWRGLLVTADTSFPTVTPTEPATIVFTSGTTGAPKAVSLSHANLLANVLALAAIRIVGPDDRALLPLPFYHIYPLTIGMITPLAMGCGIVLPAGISGPELVVAMRHGRVTALVGVPRLYTALLDNIRRGIAARPRLIATLIQTFLTLACWAQRHGTNWPGKVLLTPVRQQLAPHLRLLVSGGAAVDAEVEETLDALGWEMLTGYGLVETSSMLSFNPPGAALPGSAGRPVPGMHVRIANPDAGGVGELEVHGPSLFTGYRNDQAKTQKAFTPDGWFRTGDLGSIDRQGYLHIAARKTETIVLADGKKLFPEEFERAYGTVPLVRDIALLGQNGALVALVVPDLAAARDFGALRLEEAIRDGLAAKARMLPSYARLTGFAITRDALPRTRLGKIRRYLLLPLYEAAHRHETPSAPAELSPEDRALLDRPDMARIWRWLQQRFPDKNLQLDTVPQIDLAIDSLGWVDLTLALERDLGIVLKESAVARIVTLRDFLREAATAPKTEKADTLSDAEAPWLVPLGTSLGVIRALGDTLLRLIMRWAFQLRVEGLELLPQRDPILLCPNHVSYLDPFALAAALPRERLTHTCWSGWTGIVFTTRLRRLFSRAARIIPIDPDRAVMSGLAMGGLTLERGWNLVWFPEGARSADGKLQRFLPGVGALVEKHPVPIVPVYIEGSFSAWPVARKFPRPHRITVRFGEVIEPRPLIASTAERARDQEIASAIWARVAALAETSEA